VALALCALVARATTPPRRPQASERGAVIGAAVVLLGAPLG